MLSRIAQSKSPSAYIRPTIPALVLLGFFVLESVYFPWEKWLLIGPSLVLMTCYYWLLYYPTTISYLFLFVLGIMIDAMTGSILGISSLLLMMFRVVVRTQYRWFIAGDFWGVWLGFAAMSLVFFTAQWLFFSLYLQRLMPISAPLFTWLVTATLYPFLHKMLNHIYRRIRG